MAETVDVASAAGPPVTVVDFLLGDRTIIVGDRAGGVTSWQILSPPTGGEPRLTRIHEFQKHGGPVVAVERLPPGQGLRHRRRVRAGRSPLRDLGLEPPRPPGAGRRPPVDLLHAQGRRRARRGRPGRRHPLAAQQSASGDHARHALREGLVRGLLGPGLRLAVHRGHGRLRAQVQPDPARVRHHQGDRLRADVRGAAGAVRRPLRERVHASRPPGLHQAGGRDHGRAAERGARLPGRALAGAPGGAHRAGPVPVAAGHPRLHPGRPPPVARGAGQRARTAAARDGVPPADAGGGARRVGGLRPRRAGGDGPPRRRLPRLAPLRPSGSPTTSATRWWSAWPWASR